MIPMRLSSLDEKLNGPARTWESHTEYRPARHAGRGGNAAEALRQDALSECHRRGLPRPAVDLLDLSLGPRGGVAARLQPRFAVAVAGPLLLGRDRRPGGGLFEAMQ